MKPPLSWLKPFAAAAFAAVLAFGVAAPAAAQPWQANEDDALLLELRAGNYRLGEALRGYQTPDGLCVDMADLIQTMDLPIRLDRKSRRATGWIFAEEQRFVLDRDSSTVQTMNNSRPLLAGDVHDTPEGWCVSLSALSGWFGVNFRPDLSNLAVVVESDRKLPFLEAMERRSRAAQLRPSTVSFDLTSVPQVVTPYKSWRVPAVDVMLRGGWRREDNGDTTRSLQYDAYASGEVLGASFDARLTSDTGGVPDRLRLRAYRVDPTGNLLGPMRATEIVAGDVETFAGELTGQTAIGRGIFVTNRPVHRSSRFAATTLTGELPNGWDVELYRNGQLIGFQSDRSDGRFVFEDIELRFGQNDFEVVLYGPQGQVRRDRTSFPVGDHSIPAGKTWYWAGVVENGRDLVDLSQDYVDPRTGWRWGVGIERGLDKRTTVGVGAQSLMLDGIRRNYLEATFRRGFGPMLVELAGAQQLGRGSGRAWQGQALGRIGRINFQAQALWVDGGYESEVVTRDEKNAFGLSVDTDLILGERRVPLQGSLRRTAKRDGSTVNEWLIRSSLMMRRLSLTADLADRKSHGPSATDSDDGLRARLLGNTTVGRFRLRGNAEYRLNGPKQGFDSFNVTTETDIDRRTDLRGSVAYQADTPGVEFGLGVVRHFNRFDLRTDAMVSTSGRVDIGFSLAMSFGPNPVDGGWRVSGRKLAQYGSAAVTVYRDENGDGIRQPGEEPIEGAEIQTGYGLEQFKTNALGRTAIDGLRPFAPVLLNVDESSIEDPLLVPKGKGVVVVPRPGVAAEVLLPVAPTGEVEGVLLGAGGEALAGVTLELADRAGDVAARAQSEYDGYFLFDRVPYGDYRLRLAGASARAIGARADIGVALRLDRATPTVRLDRIRAEASGGPVQTAMSR